MPTPLLVNTALQAGLVASHEHTVIPSKLFGNIAIPNNRLIHFPAGIPGLEQEKFFGLFEMEDYRPLIWMAGTSGHFHFPIVPLSIIDHSDLDKISKDVCLPLIERMLRNQPDTIAYVILKLSPSVTNINLRAPIFIHLNERRGEQIILDRFN